MTCCRCRIKFSVVGVIALFWKRFNRCVSQNVFTLQYTVRQYTVQHYSIFMSFLGGSLTKKHVWDTVEYRILKENGILISMRT